MEETPTPNPKDPKYWYVPKEPYWFRRAVLLIFIIALTLFALSLIFPFIPALSSAAKYLTATMVFTIGALLILFGYRFIYSRMNHKTVFDEKAYQADLQKIQNQPKQ